MTTSSRSLPADAHRKLVALTKTRGYGPAARLLGISLPTLDGAIVGKVKPETVAKIVDALAKVA